MKYVENLSNEGLAPAGQRQVIYPVVVTSEEGKTYLVRVNPIGEIEVNPDAPL